MLEGKKIVLGVSGGIAIYKVVDLVSKLRKRGAEVRVVMTEHATKFVSPLLFSEISGYPAAVSSWEGGRPDSSVEHIALAEWGGFDGPGSGDGQYPRQGRLRPGR